LFLAPLSDLGKKIKTPFERAWRETPKSGVLLVHHRRRKICFGDTRTSEWPVWAQNGKKNGAHEADTLCAVLNTLFYCSGYTAPEM
jgi:hypothetical protein